jgi:hypothetical protein
MEVCLTDVLKVVSNYYYLVTPAGYVILEMKHDKGWLQFLKISITLFTTKLRKKNSLKCFLAVMFLN